MADRPAQALHSPQRMLLAISMWVLGATGDHQRWTTTNGPVHTWHRGPSVPSSVVLYVHGYRDDADSALADHKLLAQFEASGLDALFVVPDSPSGPRESVAWMDLEALLTEVAAHHRVAAFKSVLVLGHSGGNRTLKAWLASPRVDRVILLDGFYGDPRPFERWLARNGDAELIMVGEVTFAKAEAWRAGLDPAVRAKVSHQAARCSHMQIVTGGRWIPQLLAARSQ